MFGQELRLHARLEERTKTDPSLNNSPKEELKGSFIMQDNSILRSIGETRGLNCFIVFHI